MKLPIQSHFSFAAVALATVIMGVTSATSHAASLFYDGFSAGGATPGPDQYITSPASTNGVNNDSLVRSAGASAPGDGQIPATFGFSTTVGTGGWRTTEQVAGTVYAKATATGLSYSGLSTTVGGVDIARSNSATGLQIKNYARNFAADLGTGAADLYFSALMRYDAGVSGQVGIGQGLNSLSFGFNAAGNVIVSGGSTILGTTTATYAAASTYLLVAHVYGANLVDIYLNPPDLLNEAGNPGQRIFTGLALNGFAVGTAISDLRLSANTGSGVSAPDFIIDEVHGATTWAEAFVPIPEPASAQLAMLAGLVLLGRRRRV